MSLFRIGIIAPNYGRKNIFNLWCASIQRLRIEMGCYMPAVVVSEEEDKGMCQRYAIHHITQKNNPVSAKFNTAVYALQGEVDAVMIMGSDDVISTRTFNRIACEIDRGYDLVGVDTVYFFATDGVNKGKMVKLVAHNRILGVAKAISASVLDRVDWKPWNVEKNWGLDAVAQNAIKPYVQTSKVVEDAEVFDLKSKTNINKATFWIGQKIKQLEDPEKLFSILGQEETEILKQILK